MSHRYQAVESGYTLVSLAVNHCNIIVKSANMYYVSYACQVVS